MFRGLDVQVTHLPTKKLLGYFQIMAIVKKAVTKVLIYVFVQT